MGKTEWANSSKALVFDVVYVHFVLHRFVSGLILCILECLWFGDVCGITRRQIVAFFSAPEGRPGMSDVTPLSGISGLSFDSTLLPTLSFFCLSLLLFLSYLFSFSFFFCLLVYFPELFPENSSIFFVKR